MVFSISESQESLRRKKQQLEDKLRELEEAIIEEPQPKSKAKFSVSGFSAYAQRRGIQIDQPEPAGEAPPEPCVRRSSVSQVYEVVYSPRVAIREFPSLDAPCIRTAQVGTKLELFEWDHTRRWRRITVYRSRSSNVTNVFEEEDESERGPITTGDGWMLIVHPELGTLLRVGLAEASAAPDVPDVRQQGPEVPDARQRGPDVPDARQRGPDVPDVRQQGPEVPDARQRGPDVPDARQRGPDVPDVRQQGPEVPDARQWGPDVPDAWQRGPDVPDARQRGPEAPMQSARPGKLERALEAAALESTADPGSRAPRSDSDGAEHQAPRAEPQAPCAEDARWDRDAPAMYLVVAKQVAVREEPHNKARVISTQKVGQTVLMHEWDSTWCYRRMSLPDDRDGWMLIAAENGQRLLQMVDGIDDADDREDDGVAG